ncbi:MAG: hydantoinase/oxoprolinase family protein, partial [Balneolaceae bacterium]
MTDKQTSHWKICIDTGGTFTDCFGIDPGGNEHRCKVLSSSSLRGTITGRTDGRTFSIQTDWNAPDNFVKGFTFKLLGTDNHNFIVEKYDSKQHLLKLNQSPGETPVQQKNFEVSSHEEAPVLAARLLTQTPAGKPLPMMDLRLGTTKGTNALLEKNGDKTVFFITKGFKDLLLIGEQHRKDIFSLNPEKPSPLYHAVIEVDERIDCNGNILVKPEYKRIEKTITQFIDTGITSAAICLMNSYKNDIHEKYLAEWLQKKGFKYISVSSDLSPLIKIVPRARTADVNAYLAPVMEQYFDNVSRYLKNGSFKVMTSAGGLVNVDEYTPKDSLLSGPAGGVVGAASSGKDAGFNRILSFDMGGTSTDVARYEGDFDYDYEHQVGDAILVAPALSIETVAAGGGSICSFDGHALQVGPKSASADPGPACYGSKGPLTITDVNLLLGRLHPSNFHFPVEKDAAAKAFKKVSESINNHEKNDVSDSEILEGFLDIANERMAQAIRKISLQKGFEPSEYALVSFGGAGAQHACAIADKLNISTILISQDAGLLSARGLAKARIERFSEKQTLQPLDEIEPRLRSAFKKLEEEALNKVRKDITGNTGIEIKNRFVFARFKGQDSALELSWDQNSDIQHEFKTAYIRKFGHWIENRTIEIESLRVIA